MRRAVVRRAGCVALAVLAAAGAARGRAPAQVAVGAMERDDLMVGNMEQFPDPGRAGAANVRRARRLLLAGRRNAWRFDTVVEARRLGYAFGRSPRRPGFTHMRKDGARFWGRLLDPAAPQSLVVWCPSRGRCRVAAFMYRAPAGRPPSTWGDMLMWHRHAATPTATWMTHVWLVGHLRPGFATCAPMDALVADLGIRLQTPIRDTRADRPCTEPTPGMPAM